MEKMRDRQCTDLLMTNWPWLGRITFWASVVEHHRNEQIENRCGGGGGGYGVVMLVTTWGEVCFPTFINGCLVNRGNGRWLAGWLFGDWCATRFTLTLL